MDSMLYTHGTYRGYDIEHDTGADIWYATQPDPHGFVAHRLDARSREHLIAKVSQHLARRSRYAEPHVRGR